MSDHVTRTLQMVLEQISELEREVSEKKKMANALCKLAGDPPAFGDVELATGLSLRPDEFYGKPLATAVEEVLERRKRAGQGAATVAEIYDTLKRGGFHFNTKNADNAKRGLYTSFSKNSKFHRLPNGTYGLAGWYGNIKRAKPVAEQDDRERETSEGLDEGSEMLGAGALASVGEREMPQSEEERPAQARPKIKPR